MINPMGNRVLTKPHRPEETMSQGGVILPALGTEKDPVAVTADVVAIGPDCNHIEIGHLVLLSQYLGDKVDFHGEYFVLVEEPVILATIDRE